VENPTVSAYLDRLHDEYRRAAKAGQDVMDTAAGEARDLTPEETETRDRAFEDVTRLKGEIDKIRNFEDLRQAGDAFRAEAAPVIERATGKPASDAQMFRAMWTGSGAYDSRLSGHLASGDPHLALRALQSAGGSAVETTFADFVTVFERTFTPMLRPDVVTILNRTDGSPLVLPRVTADPNHGGTITAEAGGINELDLTASQVTLNPYKYAITNLWSAELSQDNTIGLEELIARTTGRELGIDIGAALTTGDGTDDPNGFITAGANAGTAAGTGSTYGTYFGPTDLVNLFYSRAEPYRRVGSWQANSTSLAAIRNARDTAGNFIWQPSLIVGQPETVLGRPIYENPAMASGSAAKSVAFGDFSRYVVSRVVPVRVESSIHYKFNTDQLALRTIERVDGDLVDTIAVAFIVGAAV
jgi:HK97 family phage major capsid protein